MERKLLSPVEARSALSDLKGWVAKDNNVERRFEFDNFADSLKFVNQVGAIAEKLDHHPDITFGWGYAEIKSTTHDRGGVTEYDIELARKIDELEG